MPLLDLMTELSIDPFQHAAFTRDPERFLAGAGLSASERASLRQWKDAGHTVAGGHWERCALIGDPGPDPSPDPDVPADDDAARASSLT